MTDSDQGEEDVQLNFIASSSQKDRWEQHADDAGFRSLSEFLRVAAEKEVASEQANVDGDGSASAEQLSDVVEGLNRVESRLKDLDDRVAGIEQEVREDPAIKKLANDVFGVLPTREDIIEYEKTAKEANALPDAPAATAGTVEGIAATLDEEEFRIEDALDKLQDDTGQIGTMTLAEEVQGWTTAYGDDENATVTRYYKEA